MYAKRFGKRKAIRRRPIRRVYRKRGGARKSIVKIVKSVLSRQAENKIWSDYGVNQSIICSQGGTPTSKNLIPTLSPGATVTTRVGNEVRVKTGYIRGHVNILPYSQSSNTKPLPIYVKMWIVSAKQLNTTNLASTSISTTFFEAGGASTGFQGNMLDIDFSPNKDSWVIHYTKTVKLGCGYVSSLNSPVLSASYFDNSPMSVPFYFAFGKKIGSLKYDESNTGPTNKNMFIVFQAVPADGDVANFQLPAEFHYTTRVEYEDM